MTRIKTENLLQGCPAEKSAEPMDSQEAFLCHATLLRSCSAQPNVPKGKVEVPEKALAKTAMRKIVHNHSIFRMSKKSIQGLFDEGFYGDKGALCFDVRAVGIVLPQEAQSINTKKEKKKCGAFGSVAVMNWVFQDAIASRLVACGSIDGHQTKTRLIAECRENIEAGFDFAVKVDKRVWISLLSNPRCVSRLMRDFSLAGADSAVVSVTHRLLNELPKVTDMVRDAGYDIFELNPLASFARDLLAKRVVLAYLRTAGHRFVYHNGEVVVFLRSERAARRVACNVERLLSQMAEMPPLAMGVQACDVRSISFLGCAFSHYAGKAQTLLNKASLETLKAEIRSMTKRSNGESYDHRARRISACVCRWKDTMRFASNEQICRLNAWLKNRLNMVFWRQQKRIRSKVSYLRRCGLDLECSCRLASSRWGHWRFVLRMEPELLSKNTLCRLGFHFFSCV